MEVKLLRECEAGNFYEPTVLYDVNNKMRVAQEEIFGPVPVIIPFKTEEDAIRIANDSIYGLAGVVWTNDLRRGQRVTSLIHAGLLMGKLLVCSRFTNTIWRGKSERYWT